MQMPCFFNLSTSLKSLHPQIIVQKIKGQTSTQKKQRFVGGLQFTTNLKHIAYVNFFQVIWALKSGDFMCMNVHMKSPDFSAQRITFKGSLSHLRGVFLDNSNFLIL